ncbi:MAG: hypothetical protein E4G89_02465, partial [Methanothrix sp.]
MQVPPVFNRPGVTFVLLPDGIKFPPVEGGWQKPENGHTYQEACEHIGNVGVRADRYHGYIGLDQDVPEAFRGPSGNIAPSTTTWKTRPGRLAMWYQCDDITPELLASFGKPADHSQFKLYRGEQAVGELKLERSYQVIPNSHKWIDPITGDDMPPGQGQRVDYELLDGIPPTKISGAQLIAEILAVGITFKMVADKKSDASTCSMPSMTVKQPVVLQVEGKARELAYASAALEWEYTKLSQIKPDSHMRYDHAYASACALGEFVAAGLLAEEEVRSRLLIACGLNGLSKKEALKSITNGLKKTAKKPRQIPDPLNDILLDAVMDGNAHELTDEEFNAYRMPEGPKFSITLPPENYISRFMAYGDEISDAYCDFWLAGALMQLAVASDKKIRVELRQGTIYANIYVSINGKSSLARKSTVAQKVEDIVTIVRPNLSWEKVPTEFSSEAFTEHMDKYQHAPWIRDEAAGVLSLMKRDYMKGFKDCLTSLYDCKPYDRKLRTSQRKAEKTTFSVHDPFLNLFWATTDASFAANTELNDTLSGFLARFLFFFPQGKKSKFMPLQEGNEMISAMETVVIDQLR